MKKITVIILMLIYGMSSSGMSVTADYCCGKLSKLGVSLSQAENSKQDNQLANKKCCGHKEVSLKVKADHETGVKQNIDFSTQLIVQPVFFDDASKLNFLNRTISQNANGPPQSNAVPGYIFNCVFRI